MTLRRPLLGGVGCGGEEPSRRGSEGQSERGGPGPCRGQDGEWLEMRSLFQ